MATPHIAGRGAGGPRGALVLSIPFFVILVLAGCTRYVEYDPDRAYYHTAFPATDVSGSLEEILDSVKRIRVTTDYDVYFFADDDAPSADVALDESVLARAVDTTRVSEDRAASAVVLSRTDQNIALLTADHAVHRADTLVEHFTPEVEVAGLASERIRSVAIKQRQTNWILNLPDMDPFEILARDELADLALIGVEFPEGHEALEEVVPLAAAPGDPDRLSWGSFVYVLGFPSGYPMVTRGIVSDPERSVTASFLIDGLWNQGMSGGPILAIRGDGEALEWVGMARAAAARTERRLVPDEDLVAEHELRAPYEGPLYVEEVRRIEYGITLSVTLFAIRDFIDRHRSELAGRGYELPEL